jgi:hypothetical protein
VPRANTGAIKGRVVFAQSGKLDVQALRMIVHSVSRPDRKEVALLPDGSFSDLEAPIGEVKVTFQYNVPGASLDSMQMPGGKVPPDAEKHILAMKKKYLDEKAKEPGFDSILPDIRVAYMKKDKTPITKTVNAGDNDWGDIKVD